MLFRSLVVSAALCAPAAIAFSPSPHTTTHTALTSALKVATPITTDELVTTEANIKETRRTKPTVDPFNPEFSRIQSVPYSDAFPNSTKEYKTVTHAETGHVLKVPFRRVHLEDPDQPYLDLYDTSGPRDINPHDGLPKIRKEWVDAREGKHERYTQMHFARKGMITEEMQFVAARENVDAEFVREELARGKLLYVCVLLIECDL